MKNILSFYCLFAIGFIYSQSAEKEIQEFQTELNQYYQDSTSTPLTKEDFKKFEGHQFFPVNMKYRVKAKFIRTKKAKVFEMPTTGSRTPEYKKYGEAHFEIDGKKLVLEIYQNQGLKKIKKYKDYLFIPFNDLTNGETSYSGGRYIDLTIPKGDEIIIDFNQCYNPLCAYNPKKYSCPIPPEANILDVEIEAGVMLNNQNH